RDLRPHGESDRVVNTANRQHTDGTSRPVHHLHIRRQEIFDPVARDGMGVAATEFHELIVSAGDGFAGDGGGHGTGEVTVAILVDMFHCGNASMSGRPGTAASRIMARVRSASPGSSLASA